MSKSVRNELAQNFESINRTMLEKIFDRVFGGNELVQAIAMDEEFVDVLNRFGRKLEGSNEAVATKTDKDGLLVQVTEKNLDRRFVLVYHGLRMVNEDSHTLTPTS